MQNLSGRSAKSSQGLKPGKMGITRKLIDRSDQAQNNSSTATETTQTADSSSQSWKANLRSRTLKLSQKTSQGTSQAGAVTTPVVECEMSPFLKSLIEFLNQQPGQALKVSQDLLPQVEALLLKAGLPAEQVENLLTSPRFQELGLTATDVQSAWQKAAQNALQGSAGALDNTLSLTSGQLASLQNRNITSQSDYQNMWQNLTLPAKSLPDLRLELQQLGVPSETLANLNEQNFPQGVSLTQVWQLIQQASQSAATTAANGNTVSPQLLNGGEDMEKWRQLLVQSGMDPELAQTMTTASTPTNQEELRTGLLKIAPPVALSQSQDTPKPLYLPENLRVHQIPVLQQENVGQGQGESSGNSGNLGLNFGSSSKSSEFNLTGTGELNNFLTLLTADASLKAAPAESTIASGGSSSAVNSLLTPEARQALWSQVQSGILGNLRPGENQVTLTLNPPEMGKLHLTLNVKGDMVEVTAVASHPAVAEAGTAGVQELAQALNQQGLTLTQFQFHHQDEAAKGETQFAFSQTPGDQKQQTGKKEADQWEQPTTARRQRGGGGIDCFA